MSVLVKVKSSVLSSFCGVMIRRTRLYVVGSSAISLPPLPLSHTCISSRLPHVVLTWGRRRGGSTQRRPFMEAISTPCSSLPRRRITSRLLPGTEYHQTAAGDSNTAPACWSTDAFCIRNPEESPSTVQMRHHKHLHSP